MNGYASQHFAELKASFLWRSGHQLKGQSERQVPVGDVNFASISFANLSSCGTGLPLYGSNQTEL